MSNSSVTVVLVDDDAAVRMTTELMLLAAGFNIVASCNDAGSALQAIDAQRPDIVVTDLQMCGPSGLDLIWAVRRTPSLWLTPALVYTASPEVVSSDVLPAQTAIIAKPASVHQFREAVMSLSDQVTLSGYAQFHRSLVGVDASERDA